MTPSAVRDGLATNLKLINGLRVHDHIPDGLAPPAAVIEPLEVTYDEAMARGLDYYRAFILVVVGRMSERSASDSLDAYIAGSGSQSIKAAVESDPTLGGACSTLRVTEALPREVIVSGVDMLAYRFEVDIYG